MTEDRTQPARLIGGPASLKIAEFEGRELRVTETCLLTGEVLRKGTYARINGVPKTAMWAGWAKDHG